MTAYISKIVRWDLEDITELRDLLNVIDRDEIDMSDLPSADIPEYVDTSYPVWAMDKAGNMLVGDAADQIMTLEGYLANSGDTAFFSVSAWNESGLYFWGTVENVERYVGWLNRNRDVNVYGYSVVPHGQWSDLEARDDVLSGEEPGWDDFMDAEQEA